MKKEIGSIFSLSDTFLENKETLLTAPRNTILYSLCREALYNLAISLSDTNNHVLIPAYTCQTVINPFKEAGWICHFYNIQKHLRIDGDSLIAQCECFKPSLIIVHPFFGMDLDDQEVQLLRHLSNRAKIVVDLTQCIFSKQNLPFVDYYLGSYRKWFPIPDGGYLRANKDFCPYNQPITENTDFVSCQRDAMYLRGAYFVNGDPNIKTISIRLSKMADAMVEKGIGLHSMSTISWSIKLQQDEERIQQIRYANYRYLFHNVSKGDKISLVCEDIRFVTTAPLYFTIYVDDRKFLQKKLIEDKVYAPIIWPVEDEEVLISDDVKYIYTHILAIPCDQRYDKQDMERIVKILNDYQK